VINLAGFGLVFAASSRPPAALSWLLAAPALFSLAFLAGALVILVSTFCRSTKEANTYLSILIFSIMGIAMWLAFRPEVSPHWLNVMPLTGHQHLLKQAFTGPASSTVHVVLVGAESLLLFVSTAASAALVLAGSWTIFEREEAVYGG
jgi:sodium transport system permease protein